MSPLFQAGELTVFEALGPGQKFMVTIASNNGTYVTFSMRDAEALAIGLTQRFTTKPAPEKPQANTAGAGGIGGGEAF